MSQADQHLSFLEIHVARQHIEALIGPEGSNSNDDNLAVDYQINVGNPCAGLGWLSLNLSGDYH